LTVEQYFVNEI